MRVSDYVVNFLIRKGVTDVFGIPGGVVLDLLYALDKRKNEIAIHLNYHEQGAAYAACGYAQVNGKLGVAYATCGPGILNMATSIADSFYDSIPVLFITAHSHTNKYTSMRIEVDQELNCVDMFSHIVKYASVVESANEVENILERAYREATEGRPGPVLLDFSSRIFDEEINICEPDKKIIPDTQVDYPLIKSSIGEALRTANRPVLLIGDGVRQSNTASCVTKFAEKNQIPVLSSRYSQDIMPRSRMYFGYIGSHGIRYSNFILSKTDLIISLGNRMAFNIASKSFAPVIQNAKTIRFDIDENEFQRDVPGSISIKADLREFMPILADSLLPYTNSSEWVNVCNKLKKDLFDCDADYPLNIFDEILKSLNFDVTIISDIGNNNLWLSRAYTHSTVFNRILYSKSLKTAGCSLGKAIGAYFCTRKPVLCLTGDQGFQMNIQELQLIKKCKLPITIVLINNFSSGMIRSEQIKRFGLKPLHTTIDSGYSIPDFGAVIKAYGIDYRLMDLNNIAEIGHVFSNIDFPNVVEIQIDETLSVTQNLPRGRPLQDFDPQLNRKLYDLLNEM